jgi:hypothetical protein
VPENGDDETVDDILKRKLGTIQNAPLPPGSPAWADVRGLTWREIKRRAKRRRAGYKTLRKLLTDGRFDRA